MPVLAALLAGTFFAQVVWLRLRNQSLGSPIRGRIFAVCMLFFWVLFPYDLYTRHDAAPAFPIIAAVLGCLAALIMLFSPRNAYGSEAHKQAPRTRLLYWGLMILGLVIIWWATGTYAAVQRWVGLAVGASCVIAAYAMTRFRSRRCSSSV